MNKLLFLIITMLTYSCQAARTNSVVFSDLKGDSKGGSFENLIITGDIKGTAEKRKDIPQKFKECTFTGEVEYVNFKQQPENIVFQKMPKNTEFNEGYSSVEVPNDQLANITVKSVPVGTNATKKDNKYYLP